MRLFFCRFPAVGGLLLLALLCVAVLAGPKYFRGDAATLIVTNTNDSGPGSLRQALAGAQNGNTIQFDPALNGQAITLTTAELVIASNVTIEGPGPSLLTIRRDQQAPDFRIFHIMPGHTVEINGLTITAGHLASDGGGIFNDNATLTISNCTISGNSIMTTVGGGAHRGGGIHNTGTLTLVNSTTRLNQAVWLGGMETLGGGISNTGTMTISQDLIELNTTDWHGGGILNDGMMTIVDSTISGNRSGFSGSHFTGQGGGIYNRSGSLTIQNTTVSGNTGGGDPQSGFGGGIFNAAALIITHSTISGNQANLFGGGISGNADITDSIISNNRTLMGHGGGIYGGGTITNCTISGNMTPGFGGGISGTATIINSTISGNTANQRGGAIYGGGTITNSTISGNSANQGGGIYAVNPVQLGDTILKAGASGTNIVNSGGNTVTSQGYNLSSDNGGGFLTATGDLINTDPMLGPLQDNGGPTFTHHLLTGSPAIDSGDPNFTPPPSTDQRGYARVFNRRIDIGSLEVQPTPTPTATSTPTATATATISPCPPVITQSTSQSLSDPVFPCLRPPPHVIQLENHYWRAFNMQTFVSGVQYDVSSVSFGVNSETVDFQPITVRLYTNNGAPFPGGTRNEIAAQTINVTSAQSGTIVTVPVAATVPAGTNELVMELHTAVAAGLFYAGANTAPETGLSYWSCENDPPAPISPHLVFNVYGSCSVATPTPTPSPTPSPGICGTLLYDQTSNAGTTAIASQNFETANDGFDSQVADDFVVPAGQTWTVQRVNASGVYFSGPGPAASVNVTFYSNSGSLPGVAVPGGTYTNLPMTDTAGTFSIPLPSNLVLTAGTYWVSVQANMDFTPGGVWGWIDRTVQSNSPAAWQNSGGSFGFGCLTWGARGATCGIDPTTPDQIFQIVGCLGAPIPTPTATATATATAVPITISGTISYCSNPVPGPVPNVTLTLAGSTSGSTLSDGSGNYTFSSLPSGGSYTVTPTKTALAPGSAGINTVDVVATQRHFLNIGTPLSGCRLTAADVNGVGGVNTVDVIAIQRFFLGLSTGIANTGNYQFSPANRTYPVVVSNQTGQNYDTLVFGDVVSPFVE